MSDKNFIRYFIILNESSSSNKKTQASGYCKIEGSNAEARFALSLRNMAQSAEYYAYATSKNSQTPIKIGAFSSASDGTVYTEYNTEQYNIFNSNVNASDIEALYILDTDAQKILCGYTNRNISEKTKHDCDLKLNNIIPLPPQNASDASNIEDLNCKENIPVEAESSMNALEALNTEISADINEPPEDTVNTDSENGFSSYLDTFAKIYEGLMGTKNTKSTVNGQSCEQSGDYMTKNKPYFDKIENTCNEIEPFAFKQLNSKWIKVSSGTNFNILGTVYENGKIKYIANGIPTTFYSFAVPFLCKYNVWFPSSDNNYGITGYWLTFINAENGNAVIPDISIL